MNKLLQIKLKTAIKEKNTQPISRLWYNQNNQSINLTVKHQIVKYVFTTYQDNGLMYLCDEIRPKDFIVHNFKQEPNLLTLLDRVFKK